MKVVDGDSSIGPGYVWRVANSDGYAATAPDAASAERFYMKPTALGRYLFYAADASILTAGGGAVSGALEPVDGSDRSEEHTSELQSLMRHSYAAFCLKTKTPNT